MHPFKNLLIFLAPWVSCTAISQNACSSRNPQSQLVVYQQAVSINTDVLLNTTFYPIPNIPVTVNNAPTSFDGITTITWTKTVAGLPLDSAHQSTTTEASNSNPSASVAQTIPTTSAYVLVVSGGERAGLLQSRQATLWIGANGDITNDCTQVPVYILATDGTLKATINGSVFLYSTDPGVDYAPLVPSQTPGTITTTFSDNSDSMLSWTNSEFWNGQASFCAFSNGTIFAVFQESADLPGCIYIQVSLSGFTSCQNVQKTGPQGSQGVQGVQGATGMYLLWVCKSILAEAVDRLNGTDWSYGGYRTPG